MYFPASEYSRPVICRVLDRVLVFETVNRASLFTSAPLLHHCHWYWYPSVGGLATEHVRLTESGWRRSGVTVGGRGEKVMGGGEGGGVGWEGICDEGSIVASVGSEGVGSVVASVGSEGVGSVVGSEGVGVSQEMGDDEGVPPHSRISLINSQSMSWLGNWKVTISSRISVTDRLRVVLDTALGLEEEEHLCVPRKLAPIAVKVGEAGKPILYEGTLNV